mgnify:CR=1 FL=1
MSGGGLDTGGEATGSTGSAGAAPVTTVAPLGCAPRAPRAATPIFALVAGEASGDQLGAGLIRALRARFPAARFVGVGGAQMIAAGLEAWYPAERLSVMGLVEVLAHLPRLLRLRRDLRARLFALRPDVFIGIDAPDFNLALERRLRAAGLRIVHYVSPSVWAWREGRARKLGASADRVLCLFPMEPPIYARYGVAARFVGHPLADTFALSPERGPARVALDLANSAKVLALLPGSRLGEIRRLARPFLAAALLLRRRLPDLVIVAPMASPACHAAFEHELLALSAADIGTDEAATGAELAGLRAAIRLLDGQAHATLLAADAVLLASGTAALEAMLAKRPMVVAYRVAAWTYRLVRWLGLMRTAVYSLPNILAGRALVPELMQDACTPGRLAAALLPLLTDPAARTAQIAEFTRLHETLRGGGDTMAAAAVAELISN